MGWLLLHITHYKVDYNYKIQQGYTQGRKYQRDTHLTHDSLLFAHQ